MADAPLPFGKRGPEPLIETSRTQRRTSDGQTVTTSWAYPYFISSVQHNASVAEVRAWIRWVFQHSRSWVRAGVWFPEVQLAKNARVVIRYVPEPLQCGDVLRAAGCTDRQMGPNGQTLIRMGRPRLATPANPQGRFKGILHELGHAAFWATHGIGFDYAQHKRGIMAMGSPEAIWPTDADIESVRDFTRGRNVVKP